MTNELFGWMLVLAGLGLGIFMGQKFQREDWLGGYGSFPRRMLRLAHVALVAIGILNIQFAEFNLQRAWRACCFLPRWKPPFRSR